MDVLTGGGLGDLCRKLILKDAQHKVRNSTLIALGFRRLLYNPYGTRIKEHLPKTPNLGRDEL